MAMKLPHVCILGYGRTYLHLTQDVDTCCGIALLCWEHIFTRGGELYSAFYYKGKHLALYDWISLDVCQIP